MKVSYRPARLSRFLLAVLAVPFSMTATAETQVADNQAMIERGRYVALTGACNDCHTPGYDEASGKVPVQEWLTGSDLGWRGPWGTTYPTNLRKRAEALTEDQWVVYMQHLRTRPPMPWYNVNGMSAEDLRALYQFLRWLGPAGGPAPEYVAPDVEPKTAYLDFTVHVPAVRQAAATRPEQVQEMFVQAYRNNDVELVMSLYEPGAVLVTETGERIQNAEDLRKFLQGFFTIRGEFNLTLVEKVESGDTAVLYSDWTLKGRDANGKRIKMAGRTADVVKLQKDGAWLISIDNPFGGNRRATRKS